ncbi:hypothetical protein RRG08_009303 [Elysia crispata]|uniref:Uncharacterized protein n=1 Tax=Elysia crispata TaxID=231223 RepID=A0AAE1CLC1_9GAST|nr:hypothetical protein RRG08_009303 [Elysia crispata]
MLSVRPSRDLEVCPRSLHSRHLIQCTPPQGLLAPAPTNHPWNTDWFSPSGPSTAGVLSLSNSCALSVITVGHSIPVARVQTCTDASRSNVANTNISL